MGTCRLEVMVTHQALAVNTKAPLGANTVHTNEG